MYTYEMMERSQRGCLVVHGLTGTPENIKPLIDELVRQGYIVNAPLLPGHGSSVESLSKTSWEEWWTAVLSAYHQLRKETKKVSCVGLSLGSLLCLRLASEMKCGVRAVVVMGTPLVLDNIVEYIAYPIVKYSPVRWLYKFQKKDWEKSVFEPRGREIYRQNSYDKMSIHAVLELFEFKKVVRKKLKEITSPIFIIHGKLDKVAPIKNVALLKRSLHSNIAEVLMLERSRHVVPLDRDRDLVTKSVVAFLNRFS